MELDIEVLFRFEFVRVENGDNSLVPTGPDRLFSSFSSQKDFDVHHIVRVSLFLVIFMVSSKAKEYFRVKVSGGVKDKVAWLQFFESQRDGESVELVSLANSEEKEKMRREPDFSGQV